MTTIPPIQSSYPVQAAYPHSLRKNRISPQVLESIHQEIADLSRIIDQLNMIDPVATKTVFPAMKQYLECLALPKFWSNDLSILIPGELIGRKSVPWIQLSPIETCEATLVMLKSLEVQRMTLRTRELHANPHLDGSLIEEHRGMQELEQRLLSKIDRERNPQEENFVTLQELPGLCPNGMLSYQRSRAGYQAHLVVKNGTHPLSVAHSLTHLNKNNQELADRSFPPLFLDENNRPIQGRAITFHTKVDPLFRYQSPLDEHRPLADSSYPALFLDGNNQPIAERSITFDPLDEQGLEKEVSTLHTLVSYYLNLGSAEPTLSFSLIVTTDSLGNQVCKPMTSTFSLGKERPEKMPEALRKIQQESMAFVSFVQKQTPEAFAENQCILLTFPTSQRDWDYLNQQLLLTLVRNILDEQKSEEEREQSLYLLQYYIDQVELELPAQEGEEGETREMTPKEAVGAILKLLPKEQPVEELDPQLLERDRQRAHPFKPKRKKALTVAEGEAKEEPPSAAEAALLLSDRQKEVIEEIYYAGKPQKAKAFFDFVRALLRQQEGVWFSQKGSHFTAHREGKVSVTLVRPHGRDATARGSLKHQRNVLRQLMGWDQGNHPAALLQ